MAGFSAYGQRFLCASLLTASLGFSKDMKINRDLATSKSARLCRE